MATKHPPFTSYISISLTSFLASLTISSAEEVHTDASAELPVTMVSAPRFIESDMEVASRIQLINAEEIAESGATNLVQLLRNEANVHFSSTSGNSAQSQISMGGFGENSGQRVLVLLDGHRLNTADLAQINWLSIPLGLVESVEVIKGGQAALYGNNAIGGVIKINTTRPTEALAGQAQVSIGSFDSYNGRFALTGREAGLGFAVHAEHDESDGFRENSQYEADGAGLKLDWAPTDWFNIYGSINAVSSEYGLPGPLTRAEMDADYNQSTEDDNIGEEDALYYRGGVAFHLGDSLTFAIDGGYTDRQFSTEFYYDNPFYPFFLIEQDYEIFSLSPTLTYENERLTAVLGLDYYDDQVDAVSTDAYSVTPYGYSRETLAAFTSFSWHLNDDWIFSGSVRLEDSQTTGEAAGVDSDDLDDDEYAWSLGLIRFLGENSRLYASGRRFYRYPATDEVINVFFVAVPTINFDLKPETGHEVEIGGDTTLGALTLGGRIFYQWMEGEIIYDSSIGMFGSNVNADDTERLGIDLLASYAMTDHVDVSLNYTWVQAEFSEGNYQGSAVPLAPQHKVRAQLEFRPKDTIKLALGATYTDGFYLGGDFANAKNELSDQILFDLNLRYAYSPEVEFFATVDNLFDKEYVSTGFSGAANDALYPGVGRSATVGVLWKF